MKSKAYILILFIFLINSINCLSQSATIDRTAGPTTHGHSKKVDYFIMFDGIPIYKFKRTLTDLDTCLIDSIIIHKKGIENNQGKVLYNAFIEFRTKDSVNEGLKYIQEETDNWTFKNPLSKLVVNNRILKWKKVLKKDWISKPEKIKEIKVIHPTENKRRYRNGILYLIIDE